MKIEVLKDRLESKLEFYNTEFNDLMNNPTMRGMCFTSAGCGNKSTQRKLTSFRNKLGDLGNKIAVTKLALKIVNTEPFIHNDILELYNSFLQQRNPEMFYEICDRIITFNSIKEMIVLILELFLKTCKKQVLKHPLIYDNENGSLFEISLSY